MEYGGGAGAGGRGRVGADDVVTTSAATALALLGLGEWTRATATVRCPPGRCWERAALTARTGGCGVDDEIRVVVSLGVHPSGKSARPSTWTCLRPGALGFFMSSLW